MKPIQKPVSPGGTFILILVFISAIAMEMGYTKNGAWYRVLVITFPLILIFAIANISTNKHSGIK
jgi:hypothetical protein